jgi:hypothetical protein
MISKKSLFVMVLVGLVASLSAESAEKNKPAPLKPPEILLTSVAPRSAIPKFVGLAFKAVNTNAVPVPYFGYTANSFAPPIKKGNIVPLHFVEFKRNGKWVKYSIGWCGTGIGPVTLSPKSTNTFTVAVPLEPKWDEVRVGFYYYTNKKRDADSRKTAWCKPILRKAVEKK